jgi:hypothetical protein
MRGMSAVVFMIILVLAGCNNNEEVVSTEKSHKMKRNLTPYDYLKDQNQEIDINNYRDFSDLSLLNEDTKKHKVFLTGNIIQSISTIPLKLNYFSI